MTSLAGQLDQAFTGIGDRRHPGITDKGNRQLFLEKIKDTGLHPFGVMLVVTLGSGMEAMRGEKFLSDSGIFAQYEVGIFEYAEGAGADVPQIANRGADQIKSGSKFTARPKIATLGCIF